MLLILERGQGERQRDRERDVREKHRSVASYTCPHQVSSLQSRYVPWPEWNGQPSVLQDDGPTNWATPPGLHLFLFFNLYYGMCYLCMNVHMHMCNMLIMKRDYWMNVREPTLQLWDWSVCCRWRICVCVPASSPALCIALPRMFSVYF